jgi:hypothetical protein
VHNMSDKGSSPARHPDKVRMTDTAELGVIDVFVCCRSGGEQVAR